MAAPRLRLGDILVREGLVTQAQLDKALEIQKKGSKENLGAIFIRLGIISEKNLVETLSKQLEIPYASREKGLLSPARDADLLRRVPEEFARKHLVLPMSRQGQTLMVALVDPLDLVLVDNLRLISGCQNVTRVIATRNDILASIDEFYGQGGMLKKAVEESYRSAERAGEAPAAKGDLSLDNLKESAETAPVVKMTELLLRQALSERASDIHIEPFRESVSIRFRIDGVLKDVPPPAKSMSLPLVSRVKILAKMDIAEKRLPQDGSFVATIDGRSVDFRVSSIPTLFGEKVVVRILDRSRVELDLGKLGFEKEELERFRKTVRQPYGLILVTGPTGSGKTTTLYAGLNEIRGPGKNIVTIEDPVEYQLDGVNQVQARPDIGLTFAVGLRSFLRQDPDVILVGEIRDFETAQIAVRAALTGHLVLSTLHTNDAPSATSRLVDIGIEPYFVNSSLLAIVAQRLVRRLCTECREAYAPRPDQLPQLLQSAKSLYKPKGCDRCSKTGYRGRFAVYELLFMNEKLERLVGQKAPVAEIRQAARESGMTTLLENAYRKVASGETSIEEVHAALQEGGA